MALFKIKETIQVMTAYIYEVEAGTKEEALELYTNKLAGTLEEENRFIVPDLEESIIAYQEE